MEKEFNYGEDRFGEVKQTVGGIQSEGIYPSIVGFKRPLIYMLLKVIMPVLFATILVFVDTIWIAVASLIVLFVGYFIAQLYFVKAKNCWNFILYMVASYVSVLLIFEENAGPRNYIGWFYIVFLMGYISLTSIE